MQTHEDLTLSSFQQIADFFFLPPKPQCSLFCVCACFKEQLSTERRHIFFIGNMEGSRGQSEVVV